MAIPIGDWNCPLPEPFVPHVNKKVPELSNFSILLLPRSVTYTLPEESTVTP